MCLEPRESGAVWSKNAAMEKQLVGKALSPLNIDLFQFPPKPLSPDGSSSFSPKLQPTFVLWHRNPIRFSGTGLAKTDGGLLLGSPILFWGSPVLAQCSHTAHAISSTETGQAEGATWARGNKRSLILRRPPDKSRLQVQVAQ